MTTTYYLTLTASDLSVPGRNFDNTLEMVAPGAATLQTLKVANGGTDTDYGFTEPANPGEDGTSGDFTVVVEVNVGDSLMDYDTAVSRVDSGGAVQGGPVTSDGGVQVATAGTLTYAFTAPSLGTWVAGDRLRVTFTMISNATMGGGIRMTHDIGSAGTRVVAPWDVVVDEGVADNAVFFGCNF